MTKLTTTTDLFYSFAQPNRPYLELMLLVVLSPARLHFCSFVEKLSHLERFFWPLACKAFPAPWTHFQSNAVYSFKLHAPLIIEQMA